MEKVELEKNIMKNEVILEEMKKTVLDFENFIKMQKAFLNQQQHTINVNLSVQKAEMDKVDKVNTKDLKLSKKIMDFIDITQKANNDEEEEMRLKNNRDFNKWFDVATNNVPHYIIENGTYIGVIQLIQPTRKNKFFQIISKLILNPKGLYFRGETVLDRVRAEEDEGEALLYLQKQMDTLQMQFFSQDAPRIIANHGIKGNKFSFHLDDTSRFYYHQLLDSRNK